MGRKRGGGGLVLFSFVVCEGGEAEYVAGDQVIGGGDLPDIVPPYPEGVGGLRVSLRRFRFLSLVKAI